jgi:hypothetical protein
MPVAEAETPPSAKRSLGMGAKIVFAMLLLIAMVAGFTSAFAAFRWQNLPVPITEAEHIRGESQAMANFNAVELIAAWEQIETTGLGEQVPFPYRTMQAMRDHWRNVCLIALGTCLGCVLLSVAVIALGRVAAVEGDT